MVKRAITLVILGLVCVFTAAGQAPVELDPAIQQAVNAFGSKISGFGPRVAVLGFGSPTSELSTYVVNELTTPIGRRSGVTVISRADIDRALGQMNLSSSSNITDPQALDAGRRLNASFVITGSLEQTGDTYRFRAALINTATRATDAVSSSNLRVNARLTQLLGPAPAPAPAPVAAPTPAPAPAPVPVPAATGTYAIGGKGPAGGIIFYDKGNNNGGWQYMEAAPTDLPNKMPMLKDSINHDDIKERAVGKGKTNTADIMKQALEKGGGFGWAVQAVTTLNINGYSDWFIPSRDELHWMYGNLHMKNLGDFKSEWYWSSTSRGWGNGFTVENFANGNQDNDGSDKSYRVRPIRQF